MLPYLLLFAGCVLFGLAGIVSFQRAEDTDYARIIQRISDIESNAADLRTKYETHDNQIDHWISLTQKAVNKLTDREKEFDFLQEHLAKLRQDNVWLGKKLADPIKVKVLRSQNPKPIPVSIVERSVELKPTKPVISKVKKQIRELSK